MFLLLLLLACWEALEMSGHAELAKVRREAPLGFRVSGFRVSGFRV